jgi:tRNA G37 N-methylase TrmD
MLTKNYHFIDHNNLINKWRDEQSLKRTEERRPDLLE